MNDDVIDEDLDEEVPEDKEVPENEDLEDEEPDAPLGNDALEPEPEPGPVTGAASTDGDDEEEDDEVPTARTKRPGTTEEDEDDDVDPDDVEADLDRILKDKIASGDDEEEDEDEPEPVGEPGQRVAVKAADEFACNTCFLIVHPRQFGRAGNLTCPEGYDPCPSIKKVGAMLKRARKG